MRNHFMFRTLVFFIVVLTFGVHFGIQAQLNSWKDECKIAAERDANTHVNKPLWFGAGCLTFVASFGCASSMGSPWGCVVGQITGIVGSSFYRPNPPAERLLGKSPEYVAFYTEAYKAKTAQIHRTWTTLGTVSGTLIFLVAWANSSGPF
ncbi:MAG: hypothetical protein OYL97_10815 [Candidatus Poribacteria bacterium]|nr:hypothetical protein [Candidatus Poribacteria bacterium]MDE0467539.1 hypothetical protein [Candidatus Poribacteria bacterium]